MIDMSKTYQTSGGEPVRILCTDAGGSRPVVGIIDDFLMRWSKDGKASPDFGDYYYDLVEVSPYERFEIDAPVLVRMAGQEWKKRHWAGVNSHGQPTTWDGGMTSWSLGDSKARTRWDEAKLAKTESEDS